MRSQPRCDRQDPAREFFEGEEEARCGLMREDVASEDVANRVRATDTNTCAGGLNLEWLQFCAYVPFQVRVNCFDAFLQKRLLVVQILEIRWGV